jgi:hypothetical protein
MNEPLVEIDIQELETFLPDEQVITWSRALEGSVPKCIVISLILVLLLLFAILIWFLVEHLS